MSIMKVGKGLNSNEKTFENGDETVIPFLPKNLTQAHYNKTSEDSTRVLYLRLPTIVKKALLLSEGWLVGRSIEHTLNGTMPKDYDIIVQDGNLYQACCSFLESQGTYRFNTFGGLKFKIGEMSIDIWPNALESYILKASYFKYAYNLKSQKLIKLEA